MWRGVLSIAISGLNVFVCSYMSNKGPLCLPPTPTPPASGGGGQRCSMWVCVHVCEILEWRGVRCLRGATRRVKLLHTACLFPLPPDAFVLCFFSFHCPFPSSHSRSPHLHDPSTFHPLLPSNSPTSRHASSSCLCLRCHSTTQPGANISPQQMIMESLPPITAPLMGDSL